jgi:hypothetical protein
MVFIPMVPQRVAAPPSARALDLGRRLKDEVERFERQYPGTSPEDLRAAAIIAIGEEPKAVSPRRRIAAILVGMIAALGVLGVMMQNVATEVSSPWPVVAMMAAVSVASLVAVVVARGRQSR